MTCVNSNKRAGVSALNTDLSIHYKYIVADREIDDFVKEDFKEICSQL